MRTSILASLADWARTKSLGFSPASSGFGRSTYVVQRRPQSQRFLRVRIESDTRSLLEELCSTEVAKSACGPMRLRIVARPRRMRRRELNAPQLFHNAMGYNQNRCQATRSQDQAACKVVTWGERPATFIEGVLVASISMCTIATCTMYYAYV